MGCCKGPRVNPFSVYEEFEAGPAPIVVTLGFGALGNDSAAAASFLSPWWNSSGVAGVTLTVVGQLAILHAGTLSRFFVTHSNPAVSGIVTYEVYVNGAGTGVVVALDTNVSVGFNLIDRILVNAGDLITVRCTNAVGIGGFQRPAFQLLLEGRTESPFWLDWSQITINAGDGAPNPASPASVSSILGEVRHPGIVRLSTGASNEGLALLEQNVFARLLGAGLKTILETMVRVPILNSVDPEERVIVEFGLADTFAGVPGAGVLFFYDPTSLNWQLTTVGAGATIVDSGVPATVDWVKLRVVVTDDTSAEFFIDGVSVGVIAANLPGTPVGSGYVIQKLAGAVDVNLEPQFLDVDYYTESNVFTPAR